MSPQENKQKIREVFQKNTADFLQVRKKTAILIPLIQTEEELHVLFERRSASVLQPFDISFPGGHVEEREDFLEAALRETEEELNIPRSQIELYGPLGKHFFYSGMLSEIFVGEVVGVPLAEIRPNPKEVSEVLAMPLRLLKEQTPETYPFDIITVRTEDFPYDRIEGGKNYRFSSGKGENLFYSCRGTTIWGYTAFLLREFLKRI